MLQKVFCYNLSNDKTAQNICFALYKCNLHNPVAGVADKVYFQTYVFLFKHAETKAVPQSADSCH
jgi:hypothetical protein